MLQTKIDAKFILVSTGILQKVTANTHVDLRTQLAASVLNSSINNKLNRTIINLIE